jgi:hypothetical protein
MHDRPGRIDHRNFREEVVGQIKERIPNHDIPAGAIRTE